MADNFLQLPTNIQRSILSGAETRLNTRAIILEKDIWLCAILRELFTLSIAMVFKGGISLSKTYSLIKCFFEDIDITIDYRFLIPSIDLNQLISKTALKKFTEQLKINYPTLEDVIQHFPYHYFLFHLLRIPHFQIKMF